MSHRNTFDSKLIVNVIFFSKNIFNGNDKENMYTIYVVKIINIDTMSEGTLQLCKPQVVKRH